jgi:haloalkane dehalogenase
VGYELLHGQVTRAQGVFSPRALHLHYSLEYIAENLDAPTVVLQYPSRRELIRELRKGYDYVGVSFLLAVFHHMKDVVALVRKHSPRSKIVLGGYGTVLPDELLEPYADYICREEGVAFMRRLLGEPEAPKPYRHPLVVSDLKVFSSKVSRTGMIFAGLGCPNGCEFCCTSHFFRRKHIPLLPTGRDIYAVIERYLDLDPDMVFVVLDEDFLLNKKRAMEFRDCVIRSGRVLSLFVFGSIRAISQYEVEEIAEMGIDGVWIGYEGTRAGFGKQKGRPVEKVFGELRDHGIGVLASMIVGMPYQDEAILDEDLEGLLSLEPALSQFLIYTASPGTPLYEKVVEAGRIRDDLARDPEKYCRAADGFTSTLKHPHFSAAEVEAQQRRCFREEFERLGPSTFRFVDIWLRGHRTLATSSSPALRKKAAWLAEEVRSAYPAFLVGRRFAPNPDVRRRIGDLEREVHAALGRPTLVERVQSVLALGLATWTAAKLRYGWFQHPSLVRHVYRLPAEAPRPARIWRRLSSLGFPVSVELRPERTVWVRPERPLGAVEARQLASSVREALRRSGNRLVLDLEKLHGIERDAAKHLAESLERFRERVRVLAPRSFSYPQAAAILAIFSLYQ